MNYRTINFISQNTNKNYIKMSNTTYKETLERWKHSLQIKKEWEQKVVDRWEREDQQKIVLA
jgi:hypothetical protein